MKIALCDDDPRHLELSYKMTAEALAQHGVSFETERFASAEELLQEINEHDYQPNIAILDIEMTGEDGISLAKDLNKIVPACRIIFLTNYIDYAPDVYETEHIWFVVKNRAQEHFASAIEKALNSFKEENKTIMIRENGSLKAIDLNQILYITKVRRKSQIHCVDRDYSDTRRPALLIPEELSDEFIRCHQGYWVSIQMIKELDHDEFVLTNNERIPISRSFKEDARKRFFRRYHF